MRNIHKKILKILETKDEFIEFRKWNPEYDILVSELDKEDLDRIRGEYPKLQLFSNPNLQEVIGITIISKIIQQKGYPKIKAYLDKREMKIIHIFYSK